VIPNPISREFFGEFSRSASRSKLQLGHEDLVFISIASDLTNPSKKITELVDLFLNSESPRKPQNKVLVLVGSNGEKFHSPENSVFWMGSLTARELAEVASATDWVLSMSDAESAGMTIAECGAQGVPALSLNVGGVGEMFMPGKSGILVDDNDEFLGVLNKLISGDIDRQNYAHQARAYSKRMFDPERIALEYVKLYSND
jgi:glycosyltransferase involved in cell wall biosynthesis